MFKTRLQTEFVVVYYYARMFRSVIDDPRQVDNSKTHV